MIDDGSGTEESAMIGHTQKNTDKLLLNDSWRQCLLNIFGQQLGLLIIKHLNSLVRIALVLIFYGIGIAFYGQAEGWSVTNCIYFVTVSVTVRFFTFYKK